MVLNEDLLSFILDYYPDWGNSPEQFLEFISVTIQLSHHDAQVHGNVQISQVPTEAELAEIFIKEFQVDLHPHKDFAELKQSSLLELDIAVVLERMRQKSADENAVYDLLEDSCSEMSKETMIQEIANEAIIYATIERLRSYIDFVRLD